jgi:putative sterol carrier protein
VNTVSPIAATRLTEDVLPPDLFEKLKPEFVAPLVLHLCSTASGETGMIFNAGMGYFNRAAVVSGPGAVVGDGKVAPAVEEIHRNWDAIHELSDAEECYNATVALSPFMDSTPTRTLPLEGEGRPALHRSRSGEAGGEGVAETPAAAEGLTVKTIFDRLPEAFQADQAVGVDVVFQFKISGPDGGDWYSTVKDGACEVNEGVHESPTTTIIMSDEDFVGLIEGTVNAMQAYTSGKLKIEGDLMKSQLIEKLFKF